MRFFDQNYLDPDVISNATVSSEQAAFPVDNVYNFQRRSKVWRSAGCFEIDSTNNKLQFAYPTLATSSTATIPSGTYSSNSALAAAIQTAITTAQPTAYIECTIDATTKKFKFSETSGHTNTFDIEPTTSNSITLTIGIDDSAVIVGVSQYLADYLRISTGEWIKWDFGITTLPEAFFLIGPRNRPIKISPSATITLQGSETDVWSAPSFEQILTYDPSVISLVNTDGLHTEGLRYWRLKIDDLDNPNGYVEIGALYLGTVYETTRGKAQYPFASAMIDRSETVFSEGGQTFSDTREKSQSFTLQWAGLTIAEVEKLVEIFETYGTSKPFFIQFDPDSSFSSSGDYFTRYCKFIEPPNYQLESPGNFSLTMSIREEL